MSQVPTTWKGYPSLANTWEPESNLRHASEILGTYKWTHQLNYLTMTTCLSPQHTTTPPSSDPPMSPGSWDSSTSHYPLTPAWTNPQIATHPLLLPLLGRAPHRHPLPSCPSNLPLPHSSRTATLLWTDWDYSTNYQLPLPHSLGPSNLLTSCFPYTLHSS